MVKRLDEKEKRKNLPISLNKKIYNLLEEVSKEKDINKSKLVEKLIRDYLKEEKGIDTSKII
jgi:metal-responsive CopG/Arc/MetJ family transcriptional regulator